MKISLIGRRTNKYSSILEEKTQEIMFTHSTVTDIAITDIHSILRKYTISDRKCDFLIADKEPWMPPEIVLVYGNQ